MTSKKPQTLIFMGIQGSGKGTQAEKLVDNFNFDFIEMGGMFRKKAAEDTPLGRKIDRLINKGGKLVPDDTAVKVLGERFERILPDASVVIDGFPRTWNQKELLEGMLKKFSRDDWKAVYRFFLHKPLIRG